MDPALLRERELFKMRAMSTPTVEKRKKEPDVSAKEDAVKKKSKPPSTPASTGPKLDTVNYKSMTGSSNYKFGVLAKIVKHMRLRHQEGDDHPLSLEEILDETNQLDVSSKVKTWLLTESLVSNPKLELTLDAKYLFKPSYKIKDRKNLLRLLKQHDLKGLGGILLEDIQESLPHCEKALKLVQNEILYVNRPMDKKKIVFYNDKTALLPVDEEFQKLWRSIAVESIDDQKIDEYLEKQGIRSMQDHGPKKVAPHKRKKPNQRKKHLKKPRDNEHLADVLETYEENQ
ncbi:general transcription factor IIE subunit 2 [Bacillus rossius redtenbacheri]|uniref:general transcription factor IIE subunit 2 n=1 Tax=Bacillus rossius redtenbacheri TaxID=93214 RepID=UPI002FDDBE95